MFLKSCEEKLGVSDANESANVVDQDPSQDQQLENPQSTRLQESNYIQTRGIL